MSEKSFANDSVKEFLVKLGSGEPTPGGGAAAALSSAMGASLLMMVANHTIGKAKYAEFEELNISIRDQAEALLGSFIDGMDKDAEAFKEVSAAFSMPKGDERLKAARSEAIGKASVSAAEAPLAVMRDSVAALALAAKMPGCSNANLLSDVLVATHCLSSGLLSAFYNVEANLPAIRRRDPELAEVLLDNAGSLILRGQDLAEEVMRKAGK